MVTSTVDEEFGLEAVLLPLSWRVQLDSAAGAGGDRLCDGQPQSSPLRLRTAAFERLGQAGKQIPRHNRPCVSDAQCALG